jgi:hypothetical protein
MPSLAVRKTTTVLDVLVWASKEAKGAQREQQQLHLAPNGELQVYPPVHAAQDDPAVLARVLADTMAASLEAADAPASRLSATAYRALATGILQNVLERPTHPTVAQLALLAKQTGAVSRHRKEPQWAAVEIASLDHLSAKIVELAEQLKVPKAVSSIWDELRSLNPATDLLTRDMLEGVELCDVDRGVLRFDLEALARHIRHEPVSTLLVATAQGDLKTSEPLQYALLEACRDALESAAPPPPSRMVDLLMQVDNDACEPIFMCESALQPLINEKRRLTKADRAAFEVKLRTLQSNARRWEAFLKAGGPVAGLEGASREFLVTMHERLEARFQADRASNQQPLVVHATQSDNRLQALRAIAGDAPATLGMADDAEVALAWNFGGRQDYFTTWVMQLALCTWPDDDVPRRNFAAMALDRADPSRLEHVYAYEQTVAEMKLHAANAFGGKLSASLTMKFLTLERNAKRMEAFLASDLSHNEAFYGVDRMFLIPWWEAMRDVLPAAAASGQAQAEAGAGPLDLVAASAEGPDPETADASESPSAQPTLPVASAVETAATMPAARILPRNRPAASRQVLLPHGMSQREDKRSAQPQPLAQATASKRPSTHAQRTDRPPTGNERWNAEGTSGHHRLSNQRWLSVEERDKTSGRLGRAKAHTQAVESKRANGR